MESPLTRFSATVEDYHRYRPGYPVALFDWILDEYTPARSERVLDLACGTGIVARELSRRGLAVVGVDPNRDMLECARASGGGAHWLCGAAERLPLASASMQLAVCGQAFHWFDLPRAIGELRRVLSRGAWSAAFWNDRVAHGLVGEYDDVIGRYSSEYAQVRRASPTLANLRLELRDAQVRERRFPNEQVLDLEALIGRACSSSYVAHGVEDLDGLRSELEALFRRFAEGGHVRFEYDTFALSWRF